jgi:hypothetical protein
MATVTDPLHLRPPQWVTPSMLPTALELCSYSVSFQATDAQFYCCLPLGHNFPKDSPEANLTLGEDSTSSRYNASYSLPERFLNPPLMTPQGDYPFDDYTVCFGPGSTYTPMTGSDGSVTEDISSYILSEDNFCVECIVDRLPVPSELVLDRFSGVMSGIIKEIDDWIGPNCFGEENKKWERVDYCGCPEGFYYDETNYPTCNSESLNMMLPYQFQVVAFNKAGFSTRTFTLPVINNWTSDRDDFIKEIVHTNKRNTFSVDGEFVDNEDYLIKMKEKGYFPTEGC